MQLDLNPSKTMEPASAINQLPVQQNSTSATTSSTTTADSHTSSSSTTTNTNYLSIDQLPDNPYSKCFTGPYDLNEEDFYKFIQSYFAKEKRATDQLNGYDQNKAISPDKVLDILHFTCATKDKIEGADLCYLTEIYDILQRLNNFDADHYPLLRLMQCCYSMVIKDAKGTTSLASRKQEIGATIRAIAQDLGNTKSTQEGAIFQQFNFYIARVLLQKLQGFAEKNPPLPIIDQIKIITGLMRRLAIYRNLCAMRATYMTVSQDGHEDEMFDKCLKSLTQEGEVCVDVAEEASTALAVSYGIDELRRVTVFTEEDEDEEHISACVYSQINNTSSATPSNVDQKSTTAAKPAERKKPVPNNIPQAIDSLKNAIELLVYMLPRCTLLHSGKDPEMHKKELDSLPIRNIKNHVIAASQVFQNHQITDKMITQKKAFYCAKLLTQKSYIECLLAILSHAEAQLSSENIDYNKLKGDIFAHRNLFDFLCSLNVNLVEVEKAHGLAGKGDVTQNICDITYLKNTFAYFINRIAKKSLEEAWKDFGPKAKKRGEDMTRQHFGTLIARGQMRIDRNYVVDMAEGDRKLAMLALEWLQWLKGVFKSNSHRVHNIINAFVQQITDVLPSPTKTISAALQSVSPATSNSSNTQKHAAGKNESTQNKGKQKKKNAKNDKNVKKDKNKKQSKNKKKQPKKHPEKQSAVLDNKKAPQPTSIANDEKNGHSEDVKDSESTKAIPEIAGGKPVESTHLGANTENAHASSSANSNAVNVTATSTNNPITEKAVSSEGAKTTMTTETRDNEQNQWQTVRKRSCIARGIPREFSLFARRRERKPGDTNAANASTSTTNARVQKQKSQTSGNNHVTCATQCTALPSAPTSSSVANNSPSVPVVNGFSGLAPTDTNIPTSTNNVSPSSSSVNTSVAAESASTQAISINTSTISTSTNSICVATSSNGDGNNTVANAMSTMNASDAKCNYPTNINITSDDLEKFYRENPIAMLYNICSKQISSGHIACIKKCAPFLTEIPFSQLEPVYRGIFCNRNSVELFNSLRFCGLLDALFPELIKMYSENRTFSWMFGKTLENVDNVNAVKTPDLCIILAMCLLPVAIYCIYQYAYDNLQAQPGQSLGFFLADGVEGLTSSELEKLVNQSLKMDDSDSDTCKKISLHLLMLLGHNQQYFFPEILRQSTNGDNAGVDYTQGAKSTGIQPFLAWINMDTGQIVAMQSVPIPPTNADINTDLDAKRSCMQRF